MTPGQLKKRAAYAAAAVILTVAGIGYISREPDLSLLPAVQVDRLRMLAVAGQDAKALRQLRLAARQGNIDALRAAAEVLLSSKDATAIADGLHFAQEGGKRGDAESCFLVGKANFDGIATATHLPDFGRAQQWFDIAAERHHPKAAYFLGLMYKSGYGVNKDLARAAQWFEKSVKLGNADAMFMLGNAYYAGEGVVASQSQALRLYQAAAALEHPLAAQTLAYAFRDGALGLPQSERESNQMMMEVTHSLSHPDPS